MHSSAIRYASGIGLVGAFALASFVPCASATTFTSSPDIFISDLTTITDDIVVPAVFPGTVLDMTIGMMIFHTFPGDLTITLEHVGVTGPITIYDTNCGRDYMDVVFSDAAAAGPSCDNIPNQPQLTNCTTNPTLFAVNGLALPAAPLSAFNGDTISGTWRLSITDTANGDTGPLCEWTLTFDGPVPVESGTWGSIKASYR